MRSKSFLFAVLATFLFTLGLVATPARAGNPSRGHLQSYSYPSVALGGANKDLFVYTPPGYFNAGDQRRFPVLYWVFPNSSPPYLWTLLQQLPGDAATPEGKLDALIDAGTLPPMIMVSLNLSFGGHNNERFLVEEVPSFIDATFRTIAKRSGRGIEGDATEAMMMPVAHADVYASISMLGATPWSGWQENVSAIQRDGAQFYLSVGDADPNYGPTLTLSSQLTTWGIPHTLDVVPGVGASFLDLYTARGVQLLQWHAARFAAASILDAGLDQDLDLPLPTVVTLSGTVNDPEQVLGPNPTFTWTLLSGPGPATLGTPGSLSTTAQLSAFGSYHFQLEAQGLTTLKDVVKVRVLDLESGIVLDLKLDDGTLDSSGQGHHGTAAGGAIPDPAGYKGAALAFDGVNDVLTVPDFAYGPAYSLSLWLKPADLAGSAYQYLFSHNGFDVAPSCNLYLPETSATLQGPEEALAGATARMRLVLRDSVGDLSNQGLTADTPTLNDGDWHHAALVVGPATGHRLFLDGRQVLAGNNGGDAFNPTTPLTFAARSVTPEGRYFQGSLDEIRLYNRALDADEVQMLVAPTVVNTAPEVQVSDGSANYSPKVITAAVTDSTPTGVLNVTWSQVSGPDTAVFSDPTHATTAVYLPRQGNYVLRLTATDGDLSRSKDITMARWTENLPGLVAQWTFDDVGSTNPYDRSGLNHSSYPNGYTYLTPGRIGGGALRFDRAQNGHMRIQSSPHLQFEPERSYSFSTWLRLAPGKQGTLLAKGTSDPATWVVRLRVTDLGQDGRLDLQAIVGGLENNQAQGLGPVLDNNSWHLVTLVHDAGSATNQLYIDGQPVGAPAASGTAMSGADVMVAGRRESGNTGIAETLDGDLDDVRIYSKALSPAEVLLIFTGPTIPPCGPPTCLFGDGFELGNTSAWSGSN